MVYFITARIDVIPMLPELVIAEMSQRRQRFDECLWHRLRSARSRLAERGRRLISVVTLNAGVAGAIKWREPWLGPVEHQGHEGFHDIMPVASRLGEVRPSLNRLRFIDRILSDSGACKCDGFFRPQRQVTHKFFRQQMR